jgi:7,8-dihydroneopterin aldolase/epimerase/oxygenase
VTDRIVLTNMVFHGRHGATEGERAHAQAFEVDVEIHLDLAPAGRTDDLARTVDYGEVFEICRGIVEGPSRQLIEALAESIASAVLERSAAADAEQVVVRVRKPRAPLQGQFDHASVEITRRRAG